MVKKSSANLIGSWAFLIGVILAVVLGFFDIFTTTWLTVLVIIGLLVGLLNIADVETQPFLLSGLALIIASAFGQVVMQAVPVLNNMLTAMLTIFVPATIVAAIRNVFLLAR